LWPSLFVLFWFGFFPQFTTTNSTSPIISMYILQRDCHLGRVLCCYPSSSGSPQSGRAAFAGSRPSDLGFFFLRGSISSLKKPHISFWHLETCSKTGLSLAQHGMLPEMVGGEGYPNAPARVSPGSQNHRIIKVGKDL